MICSGWLAGWWLGWVGSAAPAAGRPPAASGPASCPCCLWACSRPPSALVDDAHDGTHPAGGSSTHFFGRALPQATLCIWDDPPARYALVARPLVIAPGCLPSCCGGRAADRQPLRPPCALTGTGTRVWGVNATAAVTVTIAYGAKVVKGTSVAPGAGGSWMVTLPAMEAALTSTVTATDGKTTDRLLDVAVGDVLLCGGQSNM